MAKPEPLICAFDIDTEGKARRLDWGELGEDAPAGTWRWVHLDRTAPASAKWLREKAGLHPLAIEALLAEETRPRCTSLEDGTLIILRGVNLNEGTEPHNMVSIRLWLQEGRVLSLRRYPLFAALDIRTALEQNRGPGNPGEFLVDLALGLTDRMNPIILDIDDRLDELEEEGAGMTLPALRERLVELGREVIPLRRYLSPQRDAFSQILSLKVPWLDDWHRARMREAADRVTRYVEELDAIRERAGLLREELTNRLSERMNRTMYVLSIVAAIFLPLGLLTGLLGINLGGIPGSESPWGFAVFTGLLLAVTGFEIWLFRRLDWL